MAIISCAETKKIDMVQYLSDLGFEPKKIRGNDYWYHSPFRKETEPSFKVNRKFNVWYDHGLQKGGNLIDFGILFHGCSVSELLQKIERKNTFSSHQQNPLDRPGPILDAGEKAKIAIMDIRDSIKLLSLQEYLSIRKIPLPIANRFCNEVDFLLYDKKLTTIGFKNSAGGYELRSESFKGSSSPKEVTLIGHDFLKSILVFEGFFDFLSYQAIHHRKLILLPKQQQNFMILNSIGFIEKMKPRLEKYSSVRLYLDRDSKGLSVTKEFLALGNKYKDESITYKNHKDLNEYLMKEHQDLKQSKRRSMRL